MEPALSSINRSPVVTCRLVWGLMGSPQSISEAAVMRKSRLRLFPVARMSSWMGILWETVFPLLLSHRASTLSV